MSTDRVFAWVFGVIGAGALVCAIAFGAVHQFFTAALCLVMVLAEWREVKAAGE